MQSLTDGENKWILVYQDHLIKFVQPRTVTPKHAPKMAYQLSGKFNTFGASLIMKSDSSTNFVKSVIEELCSM